MEGLVQEREELVHERVGLCSWLLNLAHHSDNVEVAQLLLRHGADPNVKAKSGNTPLIMAALKGSHRMVRLLANQRKTVVDMMVNLHGNSAANMNVIILT